MQIRNVIPALLFLVAACSVSPSEKQGTGVGGAAPARATPIRALLVTGGCCHDYDSQKALIPAEVSRRANVTWTIVHEGGTGRDHKMSVFETDDWADQYDVVVHNTCFGALDDDAFIARMVDAHREKGVGAVILHCGLHSYRHLETRRWHEFLGVSSMRHDPGAPVRVENARPSHPIMATFPDAWTTPKDELYFVEQTWPGVTILAVAWSEPNKIHSPIIWTFRSGKARVFGASIGHSNETMGNPTYLDLVTRGLLWTVDKLEADGSPLPGYGSD